MGSNQYIPPEFLFDFPWWRNELARNQILHVSIITRTPRQSLLEKAPMVFPWFSPQEGCEKFVLKFPSKVRPGPPLKPPLDCQSWEFAEQMK